MDLHEAIIKCINKKPLSIDAILETINASNLYKDIENRPLSKTRILKCINDNSSSFDYVNGLVFSTSNNNWIQLFNSYSHLVDTLRSYFSRSDLQFIVASLLFLKRIYDLRNDIFNEDHILFRKIDLRNFEFNRKILTQLENFDKLIDAPNIFSESIQFLNKLDNSVLNQLFDILNRMETNHYNNYEFGYVFEYFLHSISMEFSNSTTPYTPRYLQELMTLLLNPKPFRSIYDPVCGSGGLLIEALRHTEGKLLAYGNEINPRMAQLGFMNLIMNNFFNTKLITTDCFNGINRTDSYDYILGDLPLNGVTNTTKFYELFSKYYMKLPNSGKGYGAIVLYVLSKLNNCGKAVITVSESFLFKGGSEKEIRRLLIERDVIESVISLPKGTLRPYTDSKASILVINKIKPKELKNKIKFIEGVVTESNSKAININVDQIVEQHNNNEGKSNFRILKIDALTKDLNLSVNSYGIESKLIEEMISSGTGVKLDDLVSIRSGASPKKEDISPKGHIPIIKIENLSKDILDQFLNPETIDQYIIEDSKYRRKTISKDSLFIARIGDNLKATIFKPSDENKEVIFQSGLFVMVPKNQIKQIDLEYLYYQLHTTFVLDQISRSRAGSTMPHLRIANLKEVVIPYMEIKAQKEYIASQKASIIAAERSKVEERIKAFGYEEEIEHKESDIVRTLVHQLRPTLASIDLQVNAFNRIVEKHNLENYREFEDNQNEVDQDLKDLIKIPTNRNLRELLIKFKSDTSHLSNVLTSVNKVMNYKINPKDKKDTNIYGFIKEYTESYESQKSKRLKFEVRGENVFLPIHQPSLRDLIDQLIVNAEKHAFDENTKNVLLSFKIKKIDLRNIVIIEYKNNGKVFKLTEDDYISAFKKGQKSKGAGIGGNYINRIVKAHGGNIIIKENITKGFQMTIEIPLKQEDS